jgi:hypothetical protein
MSDGSLRPSKQMFSEIGSGNTTDNRMSESYVLVPKSRLLREEAGDSTVSMIPKGLKTSSDSAMASDGKSELLNGKVSTLMPKLISLKKGMSMASSLGIKMPGMRADLTVRITYTSSANTALTSVIAVEPSASSEFSSFATLFDEVKVVSGKFVYRVTYSATPLLAPLSVVSYAPTDLTALASVASGCESKQHDLRAPSVANTVSISSPLVETKTGLFTFPFVIPKGVSARSAASAATFGDEYGSTSDASDAWGFIRPYVEAAGTAITTTLDGVLYLTVNFRSRQ